MDSHDQSKVRTACLGLLISVTGGATGLGGAWRRAPRAATTTASAAFTAEECLALLEREDPLAPLAAMDLAALGAREGIPHLARLASGAGDVDVMARIQCLRSLARLGGDEVRRLLEGMLTSEAVEGYREEVVRALGRVGDEGSLSALATVSAGPDQDLLARALQRARAAIRRRNPYRVTAAAAAA